MSKAKRYPVHGEELTYREIEEKYGISWQAIVSRVKKSGVSVEEAVDYQPYGYSRYFTGDGRIRYMYHGQLMTTNEIEKASHRTWRNIRQRMNNYGMTLDEAADSETVPVHGKYRFRGRMVSMSQAAREVGINRASIGYWMHKLNATLEETIEYLQANPVHRQQNPRSGQRRTMQGHGEQPASENAHEAPRPVDPPAPKRIAMMVFRAIYGGAPMEAGFTECVPGRVYEFGSKTYRCQVEIDGRSAVFRAYNRETGALSVARKLYAASNYAVKIVEDGHAGDLYRG